MSPMMMMIIMIDKDLDISMMMILTTMMMRFDPPPAQPFNVSALLKGFANCGHLVQVEVRMMLIIITLFNSMKGMSIMTK